MDVRLIDPRDVAWELDAPAYRVYFWHRPRADTMWHSEEWRLTGADVDEVLRWAASDGAGRYFTLGVEVPGDDERLGFVRLHGWEPPDGRPAPAFVTVCDR